MNDSGPEQHAAGIDVPPGVSNAVHATAPTCLLAGGSPDGGRMQRSDA